MVFQDSKNGETVFAYTPTAKAAKVFLVGDFNDWKADAKRMVKMKDGSFRARLHLAPGRYEYKFLVDGEWMSDPQAPEEAVNSYGTVNSVAVVTDLCGTATLGLDA